MTYTAPYGQMYLPMSDEWIPTLEQTVLEVATYAEIWSGVPIASSSSDNELLLGNIPVVGGTVTIDRNNTIRRTASNVTLLLDPAGVLLPIVNQPATNLINLFAPYGAELRLYKGLQESVSETYPTTSSGNDGGLTGTITVAAPAEIGDGDTLLAFAYNTDGSTVTVTPPPGWTLVATVNDDTYDIMWLYTKSASSEPASYTWDFSLPYCAVVMMKYPPGSVDAYVTDVDISSSVVTSTFDATDSGETIVIAAGNYNGDTLSTPAGTTFRESTVDAGNVSLFTYDIVESSTSIPSFTGTWASGEAPWTSIVVSLIADGSPPSPSVEYAMLGIFEIHEVDVVDDATGTTLVGTLQDRSDLIQRNTFNAPYATDGVSTVDVAIEDLLVTALGDVYLPFMNNLESSGTTFVPAISTYDVGDDPWEACVELAQTAGLQLYFDYAGVLQLVALPDPTTGTPCISYLEGSTPSAVTIKRVISNDSMPNIICVQSEGSNSSTQFQCFWWDSNPFSPTYYAAAPTGDFATPVTTLPPPDPASRYPTSLQLVSTSLIPNVTVTYRARAVSGSTITLTSAQAANLSIGMSVSGAGITGLATISGIASNVITVSGTITTLTVSNYIFGAATSNQDQDCQNLANAAGILAVGSIDNTTFTLRENPAHDVDDILEVQRIKSGIYLDEEDTPSPMNYVVDQVQIDLGAQKTLSLTARPCLYTEL